MDSLPRRRVAVRARAARGRRSSGPRGCRRSAVAATHGLDIEATVIEYLGMRELLLVMDNCEHVARCRRAACRPDRHAVPTGHRAGHQPRSARGPGRADTGGAAAGPIEDATALFADRAKAGRPDFDLDREPVGAVAEICRQLDGLPLAIELAAARIRVMSSLDLARRLDGLRLLTGGGARRIRGSRALPRRSTGPTDLLAEPEQTLFMRLSVFAGGFDLDAAHGVCGEDGSTEDDTLDLLTGLVDKSMVTVRSSADRTRYVVLETLRAYGRERLRELGIDDRCAVRHAVYFTELAKHAAAGMHTADEQAWVERILPDYDNLRAAFEHVMATGDIDSALRLVTSLVGVCASAHRIRGVRLGGTSPRDRRSRGSVVRRRGWLRRAGRMEPRRSHQGADAGLPRRRPLPGRGNGRVAYPGDVLADVALYEGDPADGAGALRTRDGAGSSRRRPNSVGVDAVLRRDLPGRAAYPRGGPCRSGGGRAGRRRHGQPDGPIDGRATRWVWCSRNPNRTGRWCYSTKRRSWPPQCRTSGGTA